MTNKFYFLLFFFLFLLALPLISALQVNEKIECYPNWSSNCYKIASYENDTARMKAYSSVHFSYKPDSSDDGWKYGEILQIFENNWRKLKNVSASSFGVEINVPIKNAIRYVSNKYNLVNRTFCRDYCIDNCTEIENETICYEPICNYECENVTEKEFYNWYNAPNPTYWNISIGYFAIKYTAEVPKYSQGHYNFTFEILGRNFKLDPEIDGCGILDTPNTIYTLNQSVSSSGTCMQVWASNITLDCNGFTINYSSSSVGYGVYTNSSFTTVKGCVIKTTNEAVGTNAHAIYYNGASSGNGTIFNNTIIVTNNSYRHAN